MCGLSGLIIYCNATAETKVTNFHLAPVETDEDVGRLQISVYHVASVHCHKPE
jgi:hypothetical protein